MAKNANVPAEETTEVVVAQNTALAAPALANQFEEDAGGGFENADANAFAIPFLNILQSGSPQCKRSEGAYIKGAEEGFLFNTVTQEVLNGDIGITVIPVFYRQRYLEWKPRESGGGGLAGMHEPAVGSQMLLKCKRDDKGRDVLPNGNILSDTREHYVLLVKEDGSWAPAVISMVSTQIKKSKQWMSKMDGLKMKRGDGSMFTPPQFSHSYKLTTVPESNDKGSWFGWKIEVVGQVQDPVQYAAAKAFKQAILDGVVKTADPVDDQMEPSQKNYGDDDQPF